MNAKEAHELNLEEVYDCDLFKCNHGECITHFAVGLVACSEQALENVGVDASDDEFHAELERLEDEYRELR